MPYSITLPDGSTVDNIPDDVNPSDAKRKLQAKFPQFAVKASDATFTEAAKDVGVMGLQAAVSVPQAAVGLVDLVTPGQLGKTVEDMGGDFEGTQKILRGSYSQGMQNELGAVERATQEGAGATLKAVAKNPNAILPTVVESLGLAGGGGVVARGVMKGAEVLGKKTAPIVAGAVGEGVVGAGSAAEQARTESPDRELSTRGQLSAAASGVGTGVLGFVGGKLAQRLGITDIDTALASGEVQVSAKNFARRMAEAGVSEGVFEELPQSAQEQMWQNFAADRPIMQGVPGAGALGMVAGGVMGAGAGLISGGGEKGTITPDKPPQIPPPANPITEAPPAGSVPPPEAVETFFTDTDQALAELEAEALAEETSQPEATQPVPAVAEPQTVNDLAGEEKAEYERWLDTVDGQVAAQPEQPIVNPRVEGLNENLPADRGMTAEVLRNEDNWADPNTAVPRTDRRVTRVVGTGPAAQFAGQTWGQVGAAAFDTSQGPVVMQVGEDSDVRPSHYMKAVLDELYTLAKKYNPTGVYVLLAEDATSVGSEQKELGYWFKENGVHYIVPRHLTNQLETGTHTSKPDVANAYNTNARLQAGSTLYHEFGHSILEDFFLAGLSDYEQQIVKFQLEQGQEPSSDLLAKLAPEAQALMRRWLALQKQMESGAITGHETAARYLSPSKLQTRLMKEQFKMAENTITKTPFPATRIVRPLQQQQWFNFFEFAAEQMAKVYFEEGNLEGSAITKALFPQGFDSAGFEASLRKFFAPVVEILQKIFGEMKARGWIKPEAEFKSWLESLATGEPPAEAVPPAAPVKKKRATKAKKKPAPEPKEVIPLPHETEASIDWNSKTVQQTLKSALVSLVRSGAVEIGSSQYKELQTLLKEGQYEEFVDMIEPMLDKKLKFDFVGKKSQTANLTALRKAKLWESKGVAPETIWKKLGWVRGKDYKWRSEISSKDAKVLKWPDFFKFTGPQTKLSEVLHHPELYKAYPQLKDLEIGRGLFLFWPGTGGYSSKYKRILLGPANSANLEQDRALLLHEVQHAIQDIEGFAPGGNPDQFLPPSHAEEEKLTNEAIRTYFESPIGKTAVRDITARLVKKYNLAAEFLSPSSISGLVRGWIGDLDRTDWKTKKVVKIRAQEIMEAAKESLSRPDFFQFASIMEMAKVASQLAKKKSKATDLYMKLLGEYEARLTESRMDMTMEERRASMPTIPDDFIVDWSGGLSASQQNPSWAAGTKVADANGEPLVVLHAGEMQWNVDGAPIWVFTPNALDANWIASLPGRSSHAGILAPYQVRLLSPLEVDAGGQQIHAFFVQQQVRRAKAAGLDGVVIRNAGGYQAPIFISFSRDNNQLLPGSKPKSTQIRFDLTTKDGNEIASIWQIARQNLSLKLVGIALHKIIRQQFNVLQLQQISHIHPDWAFIRMWEEHRVKFYRKVGQLHGPADAVTRQLEWLGKEKSALMQKFTLEEYRKGQHWTEIVPVDKYHWEHRPTAKLLEKLKEYGIDFDSKSGKHFMQLYLDAKNVLQYQQDEMERVMLVLRGQKYRGNPRRMKQEMDSVRVQFSILRNTPFWPQQLFGSRVVQVYRDTPEGRKLIAESATDSLAAAIRMEENARKQFPNDTVVSKDRHQEEAFLLRLPAEFVDEAAVILGLDPKVKEDQDKITQLRELMQTVYASKPQEIYDPALREVKGRGGEFIRNFADFALRNSNFISKMEFRKYFDSASNMAQIQIDRTPHGIERDTLVSAKSLMEDSVKYMMNPTEEAHRIRAFVAITYLWGNVKTAFLNLWGLWGTYALLNRELGYLGGAKAVAKGAFGSAKTLGYETVPFVENLLQNATKDSLQSVVDPNWEIKDGVKSELRLALEQAKRENVLDQSYAYYLAGQALRGQLMRAANMSMIGKAFKFTVDLGMGPFRAMELGIRRASFIAFYTALQKTRPELAPEQRYEEAVRMVGLTQGDYTKGNRPRIMRGPAMSVLTIFMTFVHNQAWGVYGGVETGFKRQEKLEGRPSPKFYRSYTTQMILLYLVAAGLEGLPFAENILDFADMVFKYTNNGKTARLTLQEFLAENLEDPEAVMRFSRGLTWDVAGMDWSRSVGLGRPIPGTDVLADQYKNPKDLIGAIVLGLSGVAGGYLSWGIDTAMAFSNKWFAGGMPFGIVAQDQMAKMPGGIGGMMKAHQWAHADARGPSGGLLAHDLETGEARELTQAEITMKALNFQPSSVSRTQIAKSLQNESVVYWDNRRKALLGNLFYAETIIQDREAAADVRREIAQFNEDVPTAKMKIDYATIKRSRDQRNKALEREEELSPAKKMYEEEAQNIREDLGLE